MADDLLYLMPFVCLSAAIVATLLSATRYARAGRSWAFAGGFCTAVALSLFMVIWGG